jgi:hypothetical protein
VKPATKALLLVWHGMTTTNWAGPISTVASSAFGVSVSAQARVWMQADACQMPSQILARLDAIAHFRAIYTQF